MGTIELNIGITKPRTKANTVDENVGAMLR
jgi:hypothetical protein